ncbi:MAG: helix-turn-helix transcriptional regulator [Anaerovoracaceae bacterium]|nr:helix-turn-helix transcriptional regulator [Anaerovoracaceae bacterium]
MLNENIRTIRKAKGLSQQELAVKINVVRQTVSKWEQGMSVPDSDMLLCLSEALETPVSILLGDTVEESEVDELKAIAEKLEIINLQLAQKKEGRRKTLHRIFIAVCIIVIISFAGLAAFGSPYLFWDYNDPEMAAAGVILHGIEWVSVRLAPVVFVGALIGAVMTRKV